MKLPAGKTQHIDFAAIWREYYPKLLFFVSSFFHCAQDREDAVQEIFARALKALTRYDPNYSISTWIYTIARNYCLNCIKQKQYRQQLKQDCIAQYGEQDSVFDPEELFINIEQQDKVRDLIRQLDETDQQLCYLYHYEDLCYQEISRILEMPVGTLKYRMHRIRNKIKKGMEAYNAGKTS